MNRLVQSEVSKHLEEHGEVELSRRIEAMGPSDRLRLAAELLEGNRPNLAAAVIAGVVAEIELVLCRPKLHLGEYR